jgi:hypothetical protein
MSALINNGSLLFSGIWALCETVVIFTLAFKFFSKLIKRLDRIEYALYNDGQTGLINKVDQLIENQQCIRVDVEVMKSKIDN